MAPECSALYSSLYSLHGPRDEHLQAQPSLSGSQTESIVQHGTPTTNGKVDFFKPILSGLGKQRISQILRSLEGVLKKGSKDSKGERGIPAVDPPPGRPVPDVPRSIVVPKNTETTDTTYYRIGDYVIHHGRLATIQEEETPSIALGKLLLCLEPGLRSDDCSPTKLTTLAQVIRITAPTTFPPLYVDVRGQDGSPFHVLDPACRSINYRSEPTLSIVLKPPPVTTDGVPLGTPNKPPGAQQSISAKEQEDKIQRNGNEPPVIAVWEPLLSRMQRIQLAVQLADALLRPNISPWLSDHGRKGGSHEYRNARIAGPDIGVTEAPCDPSDSPPSNPVGPHDSANQALGSTHGRNSGARSRKRLWVDGPTGRNGAEGNGEDDDDEPGRPPSTDQPQDCLVAEDTSKCFIRSLWPESCGSSAWSACETKNKGGPVSILVGHLINKHRLIRALHHILESGKTACKKGKYLTLCPTDDFYRSGASRCETCKDYPKLKNAVGDIRHGGPSICASCWAMHATREELVKHIKDGCNYNDRYKSKRQALMWLYSMLRENRHQASPSAAPYFPPPALTPATPAPDYAPDSAAALILAPPLALASGLLPASGSYPDLASHETLEDYRPLSANLLPGPEIHGGEPHTQKPSSNTYAMAPSLKPPDPGLMRREDLEEQYIQIRNENIRLLEEISAFRQFHNETQINTLCANVNLETRLGRDPYSAPVTAGRRQALNTPGINYTPPANAYPDLTPDKQAGLHTDSGVGNDVWDETRCSSPLSCKLDKLPER